LLLGGLGGCVAHLAPLWHMPYGCEGLLVQILSSWLRTLVKQFCLMSRLQSGDNLPVRRNFKISTTFNIV
jgi:hypothetical protein